MLDAKKLYELFIGMCYFEFMIFWDAHKFMQF